MVTVFLKNGEKAPMPDATYVKLEATGTASTLHCFYGDREVGVFKWDEVAGYTLSVLDRDALSSAASYEAWGTRP